MKADIKVKFRDLEHLFDSMDQAELQRCADCIIHYASDTALRDEYLERRQPYNDYEAYPGVVIHR